MSIGSVVSWLVCGVLVGAIARFLVPGRQSMTLGMTALLGVAGALLGGFVYSLLQGASAEPFSLARHNWYGWIVAMLGAMVLVWLYPVFFPRKWWN